MQNTERDTSILVPFEDLRKYIFLSFEPFELVLLVNGCIFFPENLRKLKRRTKNVKKVVRASKPSAWRASRFRLSSQPHRFSDDRVTKPGKDATDYISWKKSFCSLD